MEHKKISDMEHVSIHCSTKSYLIRSCSLFLLALRFHDMWKQNLGELSFKFSTEVR